MKQRDRAPSQTDLHRPGWFIRLRSMLLFVLLSMVAIGVPGDRVAAQGTPPWPAPYEAASLTPESSTRFSTTQISIPTYPYADYLETAYNATYNMSYPVLDWERYPADPSPTSRTYQLLVLENAYLKVTLMPELGGRIYQLIDKSTGHNQLYQNPVIKPTRWGPPEQGWWLSVGGIEWCLPVDEHGYEWGVPWSWSVITSTAGVTVTVQDTQASDRLRASVDVFLPNERAYVVASPRVENPTDQAIDFKFWVNAATAPGAMNAPTEGLAFVFNASEMAVHSTGDDRLPGAWPTVPTDTDYLFRWPEHGGVDYSRLRNWTEWLGFFEFPQAPRDFIGVYDHQQEAGLMRIFPHEIARGSKGFATGWSNALPWHLWTDVPSGGVELHGGLAPTFWDMVTLPAGQSISYDEFWYPVRYVGEVAVASREAALGLSKTDEQLHLALQPTRAFASNETELYVWDRTSCQELAHWRLLARDPTAGYYNTLNVGHRTLDQISVAFVDADAWFNEAFLAAYGPTDCLGYVKPEPHLGYGINVREVDRVPALMDPLGFEWVKLWEEYTPALPDDLSYNILYNLSCGAYVNDLVGWRQHVAAVAEQGVGLVQAYEICNEPNIRSASWGGNDPDPERFAEMLCVAYDEIKAVDPQAVVVSGGLAPVGRIPPPWPCGEGNNCLAMDEATYLEDMLASGAASCIDALGYHSYGFASAPEADYDTVTNGFAFRGMEAVRDILDQAGLSYMPVWATEFNWIRRPVDDGYESCDEDEEWVEYFQWQEVSAEAQADYLVRAFEYADAHWPWLEGMFVWNLDWHDYLPWYSCFHSRYYALRRQDGSFLGAPTPAYDALAAMEKRPGLLSTPALWVSPLRPTLIAEVSDPQVLTATVQVENVGLGTLTWSAKILPGGTMVPQLSATQGVEGEELHMRLDTHGMSTGTYTSTILIGALPSTTRNAPQEVELVLHVVSEMRRVYLPTVLRSNPEPEPPTPEPTPQPTVVAEPHGPSKIGFHAIASGGAFETARDLRDEGAHVALVKGLSFGYLCDIKRVSPDTVTVGRWSDSTWEAVTPEGDPAAQAAEHMDVHMDRWEDYQHCVDYWEVLNEVDPPSIEGHVWLAEFFKAAMTIAESHGYKLALFSYSMGVPEIYEWEAIAETGVFAQAQAGGHILALHEYGGPLLSSRWGEALPLYPGQDPEDPSLPRYPDRGVLGGRYRHLYRDILIPRGEVIPLAITEANVAIEDPEEREAVFLEDIVFYDERLREDDYVLGMAIFTLGGMSGWDHFDYSEFLPDLSQRIITLKDE
ncbi:MAG: DUF5107 domain-containing protein [Anaerolineae bacterium]